MNCTGLLYLSYSPLLIKPTSCCAALDFPSHFFIVQGEVAIVEVTIVDGLEREVAVVGGGGGDDVVLFWLRVVFVLFSCCSRVVLVLFSCCCCSSSSPSSSPSCCIGVVLLSACRLILSKWVMISL